MNSRIKICLLALVISITLFFVFLRSGNSESSKKLENYDYTILEVVSNESYQKLGYDIENNSPIDLSKLSESDKKVLADNVSTLDYARIRHAVIAKDDNYSESMGYKAIRGYFEKSKSGEYKPIFFSGNKKKKYKFVNNAYVEDKNGKYYLDSTGKYVKCFLIDNNDNYIISFEKFSREKEKVDDSYEFVPCDYAIDLCYTDDTYKIVKSYMSKELKNDYKAAKYKGVESLECFCNSDDETVTELVYSNGLDSVFAEYDNIGVKVVRYCDLTKNIIDSVDTIYFNQDRNKVLSKMYKKYNNSGTYSTEDSDFDFSSSEIVKFIYKKVADNELNILFDKKCNFDSDKKLNNFEVLYYLLLSADKRVYNKLNFVDSLDFSNATINNILKKFADIVGEENVSTDSLKPYGIFNPYLNNLSVYENNIVLLGSDILDDNLYCNLISDNFQRAMKGVASNNSLKVLDVEPCSVDNNEQIKNGLLAKLIASDKLSESANIDLDTMQSKTLAGIRRDITSEYDMIYIGSNTSKMNTGDVLVQKKNDTVVVELEEAKNGVDYNFVENGYFNDSGEVTNITEGELDENCTITYSDDKKGIHVKASACGRSTVSVEVNKDIVMDLFVVVQDTSFNNKDLSVVVDSDEDRTVIKDFEKKCYETRRNIDENYFPVEPMPFKTDYSWMTGNTFVNSGHNKTLNVKYGLDFKDSLSDCNLVYNKIPATNRFENKSIKDLPEWCSVYDSASKFPRFTLQNYNNSITFKKIFYFKANDYFNMLRFSCSDDNVKLVMTEYIASPSRGSEGTGTKYYNYTPNFSPVGVFSIRAKYKLFYGDKDSVNENVFQYMCRNYGGYYYTISLVYTGDKKIDSSYWDNLIENDDLRIYYYSFWNADADFYVSNSGAIEGNSCSSLTSGDNKLVDGVDLYVKSNRKYKNTNDNIAVKTDLEYDYDNANVPLEKSGFGSYADTDKTTALYNYYYMNSSRQITGVSVDNKITFYRQESKSVKKKNNTVYNDKKMNGLIYTDIGDEFGIFDNIVYGDAEYLLHSESGKSRLSGNDISSYIADKLSDTEKCLLMSGNLSDNEYINAISKNSYMYSLYSRLNKTKKLYFDDNLVNSDFSITKSELSFKPVYSDDPKDISELNILQIVPSNVTKSTILEESIFKRLFSDFDIDVNVVTQTDDECIEDMNDYDVVLLGSNGAKFGVYYTKSKFIKELKEYISNGGGVVLTYGVMHDAGMNNTFYSKFRDIFGMSRYGYTVGTDYNIDESDFTQTFDNFSSSHEKLSDYSKVKTANGYSDYFSLLSSLGASAKCEYNVLNNDLLFNGTSSFVNNLNVRNLSFNDFSFSPKLSLINEEHALLNYPYPITDDMKIARTSSALYQLNLGNNDLVPVACLDSAESKSANPLVNFVSNDKCDVRNNYFEYALKNIVYLGVGAEDVLTQDEYKMLVNALVYAGSNSNKIKIKVYDLDKVEDTYNLYVDEDYSDNPVGIDKNIDIELQNVKEDSYVNVPNAKLLDYDTRVELPKEKIKINDKDMDVYKLDDSGKYILSVTKVTNNRAITFSAYNKIGSNFIKSSVNITIAKRFMFDLS